MLRKIPYRACEVFYFYSGNDWPFVNTWCSHRYSSMAKTLFYFVIFNGKGFYLGRDSKVAQDHLFNNCRLRVVNDLIIKILYITGKLLPK